MYTQQLSLMWDKASIAKNEGWKVSLTPEVLDEVRRELEFLRKNGKTWEQFVNGSYQIPYPAISNFSNHLLDLLFGKFGVALVNGLDLKSFSHEEARLLLLMIGSNLGSIIRQQRILHDIRNTENDRQRTFKTLDFSKSNLSSGLHTDSSHNINIMPDVVGLLCVQNARQGGDTRISNALNVHEILKQNSPDILKCLYQEFIRESRWEGKEPSLQERLSNSIPIFSYGLFTDGLSFRYSKYRLYRPYELGVKTLSAQQNEALECLETVLNSPSLVHTFTMLPGQILFTNNHILAHERTPFVEWDEPSKRRHMVRMWVKLSRRGSVLSR
ncbi:TauD/TfdA family dioxygenase [Mastigocladopsis repens]|uniref:TauD/TfdA family dioxygenase n=1 Tax=Mastigocladopsis repens TaxID=221287 RepID=UPI0002DB503E|nr:TauD/TfdA family dioxygenase [Mastigocladopsis repens]